MGKASSSPESLRRGLPPFALLAVLTAAWALAAHQPETQTGATPKAVPRLVDLSLLVAQEYPCTWPTWPKFQMNHYERIGLLSPYNSDVLIMDGNTGTQLDVPPHSVALPETGLPQAGKFGTAF